MNYDENNFDTLDLSFLREVKNIFCHTLNEYSIVITRLALKHTSAEIYFLNPLEKIFFNENSRLHIVEKFTAADENETLQIVDGFVSGYLEGNFEKISAMPAFHSIFFKQSLTNLNVAKIF